jgi:hypothetical protein
MESETQISAFEEKLYSIFAEISQEFNYPENTFTIKKNLLKIF